jgi:surfeit locus 1 family protein
MASTARNFAGLAVITGVMIAVLLSLAAWQLERLSAKTELLQHLEERVAAAPVALPPDDQWTRADLDYLKVTVSGSFRHDQETYLFGVIDKNERGDNVPGYFVLTPLVLDNGATLIVNRGFVPQDKKDPATRSAGQVTGRVTITGLLRAPERKSMFTPDADVKNRVIYARDPALIAEWLKLTRAAPFMLDADATPNQGGLPVGGNTIVSVPNNHLQYAVTWFALALVMAGMFGAYAVKRRKQPLD